MTENSRKQNTLLNITLYLISFFLFSLLSEQAPEEQEEQSTSSPSRPQNDSASVTVNQHNNIVEVKDILQLKVSLKE